MADRQIRSGMEFVCTVPDGARLAYINGEVIVLHPDYPLQRVDYELKKLVEADIDPTGPLTSKQEELAY